MITLLPAIIVFLIEVYLFVLWLKSRQKKDGKERRICLYGFLAGQAYLLWETIWIEYTGKPSPGSVEQQMSMGRLLLGSAIGGVFTIIGLFYLSFAAHSRDS